MSDLDNGLKMDRRSFARLAAAGLTAGLFAARPGAGIAQAQPASDAFTALRDRPVSIGFLVFPDIDQIDFTGPFEVLVRVPESTVHVIGTEEGPFRDHKGLIITPESTLATAPAVDLLVVPGGPGQQALMQDAQVLSFIRDHVGAGKPLFSVCTGALICGAAGVLVGRRATTHWASFDLLPYFGATPVSERVVADGAVVSAAGVTAGLDGAFIVAAMLRGEEAAQQIQLDIQYAPQPPFNAGAPETAPASVLEAVRWRYQPLIDERLVTARAAAQALGVIPPA